MEPRPSRIEPAPDHDDSSAFAPLPELEPEPGGAAIAGPNRERSRFLPLIAASLLSAVMASAATAFIVVGEVAPGGTGVRATPGSAETAATASTAATTVKVLDLTDVVATARASVVTITADGISTRGFSPFGQQVQGVGSGIVISSRPATSSPTATW